VNRAPPQSIQAWSFALPAPMQWATFDLFPTPPIPPGLLSIIYLDGRVDTFVGVPQPTAIAFSSASDQRRFYDNNIRRVYPQALLVEGTNFPITLEQGGVLTL
jgi:hypothetical protein